MPTYEYACSACGHQWEQSQRITEPAIELCPSCAQSAAHRLISGGTNFILKGGGWYSDLYASPKASPAEKSDKPEKSGAEKSESKDGKPDKGGASSPEPAAKPASPDPAPASPKPAPNTSSAASS